MNDPRHRHGHPANALRCRSRLVHGPVSADIRRAASVVAVGLVNGSRHRERVRVVSAPCRRYDRSTNALRCRSQLVHGPVSAADIPCAASVVEVGLVNDSRNRHRARVVSAPCGRCDRPAIGLRRRGRPVHGPVSAADIRRVASVVEVGLVNGSRHRARVRVVSAPCRRYDRSANAFRRRDRRVNRSTSGAVVRRADSAANLLDLSTIALAPGDAR